MKPKIWSGLLALAAILMSASLQASEPTSKYICQWAVGEIVIDGRMDEAAWRAAVEIPSFTVPWGEGEAGRTPRAATRARLLWDRQFLYFHAIMQDRDLFADIEEHDGRTWHNDVFEMFFKPSAQHDGYYEFHVSAAGTVMDMFIPQRTKTLFADNVATDKFNIEATVILEGSLNQRDDVDKGWQVEGRIPWTDFLPSGGRPVPGEAWQFSLCRYDYDKRFETPDLSTTAPLTQQNFHQHEKFGELLFAGSGGIENKYQAVTSSQVKGSPEPPLPYNLVRVLPKLQLNNPIFVEREPGLKRLLIIDQDPEGGSQRVARTTDDGSSGGLETLLTSPDTLYSLTFDPQYEQNGWLYVASNGSIEGQEGKKFCRVTRHTIARTAPYQLVPDSSLLIIEWESNGHNGAAVTFGHDDMLYVTSGDGTSDSDTNLTGQGMDHLLAKLLRLDVRFANQAKPYKVPPDNPFVDLEGARPETWAFGFRNPWRITTDARTGHIWVGQNGQDLWEQAYLIQRGANYGWSVYEGSHPFYLERKMGPGPLVKPTLEHHHLEARSLTGGIVYYGSRFPELQGAYIYGDYSTGKIWAARHNGNRLQWHKEVADGTLQIVGFAADTNGELLIIDYRAGTEGGFYTFEPNTTEASDSRFPLKLSQSGLFESVADYQLKPGAIPYEVNSPLWSDGSLKSRHVVLTDDHATIGFSPTGNWTFPDGTVLVKSFALEMTEGRPESRRWIETRFLLREQGEWVGYSYAWNRQQTDARLVSKEGQDRTFRLNVDGKVREQSWHYPSRTECMICHSRAANYVLGVNTHQVNKPFIRAGREDNHLQAFERAGVFRINWASQAGGTLKQAANQRVPAESPLLVGDLSDLPKLADPYDKQAGLDERVRSYLSANCAQCHAPAGGGNSQMDLRISASLEATKIVGVKPLHGSHGIEGALLVQPGLPDKSVLLTRMAVRGRGQMPQLATSRVDVEAVALLRAWIEQLPPVEVGDGEKDAGQ
jgi:uncharacterized repeat protein (TIGR03806 family)